MNLSRRDLHPTSYGLDLEWWRGDDEAKRMDYLAQDVEAFRAADPDTFPFGYMYRNNEPKLRERLLETNEPSRFPLLDTLRERGATDYFACDTPMGNADDVGPFAGFTTSWVTDAADGFSDADIACIERLLPMLGIAVKAASTYSVADTLLATYLGADAGRRVLHGEIRRGEVESIRAVLWLCDLRDFTRIADTAAADQFTEMLNGAYECMGEALAEQGGEILKFMGDGLLAIIRVEDGADPAEACRRAMKAAWQAYECIRERNHKRDVLGLPIGDPTPALHLGDVLYGNVGASDRLDFTVVGPAVNEVSRIEAMSRQVDRDILFSADFVAALAPEQQGKTVSLGRYALRGVSRAQELFTLAPDLLPAADA